MSECAVRAARDDELPAVAGLRWRWVVDQGATPAIDRGEFVARFVDWARLNTATHHCLVALRDEVVLGMAWLAVLPRVPAPNALDRISGDVQCVYVVPEERDSGLGGQLIEAVQSLARQLGAERVTVHSSARAVPGYARWGFETSDRLRQVKLNYPAE
ncbi:N-acetylglutamate synthase-like GNAT family acetyltransferase [Tamaricihabitans halophyticus]|uniref:N-acetylglutamate synthase-like GNAT family acetyltransferase n=1 Tax=Tamaricihabitans halophyticus TaxID=1262583 RepID=A0A4R2QW04_9PSEU|nr:GNAT family N-acetyltransferase [Tamaricihabitans halophyticus]TCP54282.1 N-acetylglutamate synthase-like GNAT family acetyltransferase [Tamaricihabitans halophyticus]